jgi:hypothetical protein
VRSLLNAVYIMFSDVYHKVRCATFSLYHDDAITKQKQTNKRKQSTATLHLKEDHTIYLLPYLPSLT